MKCRGVPMAVANHLTFCIWSKGNEARLPRPVFATAELFGMLRGPGCPPGGQALRAGMRLPICLFAHEFLYTMTLALLMGSNLPAATATNNKLV